MGVSFYVVTVLLVSWQVLLVSLVGAAGFLVVLQICTYALESWLSVSQLTARPCKHSMVSLNP